MTDVLTDQVLVVPTTDELAAADRLTAGALLEALRARRSAPPALPRVPVGPFAVADASRQQVVDHLVAAYRSGEGHVAFALHVGGLLSRSSAPYVRAMASADLVYADGVSIVGLARRAGAVDVERAATTDIAPELLERLAREEGAPPRVALVGGPEGLAARAGERLAETCGVDVVLAEHGYHDDWNPVLAELLEAQPDVVVVGLGAPREMLWVQEHRAALQGRLVLTCGGWFGFVAGEEARAPQLVQRLHGEWVWRWAQSPRRLARRYVLGALVVARLSLAARRRRAEVVLP